MSNRHTKTKIKFSFLDYFYMYKKSGLRLPYNYFINTRLFDIIYGTDTHAWLPKKNYINQPDSFEDGILYMASWTNEIKKIFKKLHSLRHLDNQYTFVDVGCGKGKVCILWKLLHTKHRLTCKIVGVDYYEPLLEISKNNYFKVFGEYGKFIQGDASAFDFSIFGENVIYFLNNPFNEKIIVKFLEKLNNKKIIIIYNNPIHHKCFYNYNFKLIYENFGWHPNCQTKLFLR